MVTTRYGRNSMLQVSYIWKSHTGFRLVPTSMTLNGVIAFILRFFHRIW